MHVDDCYFCLVNISGMSTKTKSSIQYPNLPSALRPVAHCDKVPVPICTTLGVSYEDEFCQSTDTDCEDFVALEVDAGMHQTFKQAEFNDLI